MPTLRQLRREHALTQEQLAASADVSPSTVYHIEAGKVHPRPSIIRRLARVLEVHPGDIAIDAAEEPSCLDQPERIADE